MTSFHNLETPISGHILIVDDEPSVLAIAAAILNTIEVTPLKARNGEEALATVQSHYASGQQVALVVLDLTMPGGMSGFETMAALREIDPDIRVIACSGFFQDDALDLCRSIGFSNILAKPYTPDSLLGLIRRTLNEAPPPRPPVQPRPSETTYEGGAAFTPSASTTPSSAVASFNFSSPHGDLDDEEADEPVYHSPSQPAHFAPTESTPYHPVAQVEPAIASSPALVAESPEPEPSADTARSRRPSFLASALAQSVRSRLQPHRDPADTSSTDASPAQPTE